MKRTIEFLFEAGMLKKTPRTGYQFLGSGSESVADHSFRTTVIGYVLASMDPQVDQDRVMKMCLFHDLPEARTADHNYVNKRYTKVDEEGALRDQLKDTAFGPEIRELHREFNEGRSAEAMIARDADQLDLIMELKEQLDSGNPNAKDWLVYAQKRLVTENAITAAGQILEGHSSDWWFKKKSDWWVNGPDNCKKVE